MEGIRADRLAFDVTTDLPILVSLEARAVTTEVWNAAHESGCACACVCVLPAHKSGYVFGAFTLSSVLTPWPYRLWF